MEAAAFGWGGKLCFCLFYQARRACAVLSTLVVSHPLFIMTLTLPVARAEYAQSPAVCRKEIQEHIEKGC